MKREQLKNEAEMAKILAGASSAFVDIVTDIVVDSTDKLTHDAQIYAVIACLVEDLADAMIDPNGLQTILDCLTLKFNKSHHVNN